MQCGWSIDPVISQVGRGIYCIDLPADWIGLRSDRIDRRIYCTDLRGDWIDLLAPAWTRAERARHRGVRDAVRRTRDACGRARAPRANGADVHAANGRSARLPHVRWRGRRVLGVRVRAQAPAGRDRLTLCVRESGDRSAPRHADSARAAQCTAGDGGGGFAAGKHVGENLLGDFGADFAGLHQLSQFENRSRFELQLRESGSRLS